MSTKASLVQKDPYVSLTYQWWGKVRLGMMMRKYHPFSPLLYPLQAPASSSKNCQLKKGVQQSSLLFFILLLLFYFLYYFFLVVTNIKKNKTKEEPNWPGKASKWGDH
jgi:hypothetical protein